MTDSNSVPASRSLTRPYYLLRTSDARNHFFRYEIVRAIFHSSDPISRFLPRGEVVGKPDSRVHQEGQEPKLEYDLSEFDLEDPRPLDYLTDSEIDAFADAVEDFLLRTDSARQVSSYERDLRDSFRLPDPTREKDAYWTYGPNKNRKLLILHGCEFEPDTSWEPDAVVKYLRENCRLPWGMAQEHIIERIRETGEPLAYIVGRPAGSGVAVNGRVIPNTELKPLKRFPEKMTQAFRLAAEDFYRRSHDESGSESSEIELRKQFRLPDPAKRPEAFFSYKSDQYSGVVISLSETAQEEECLPLCPDPKVDSTLNQETLADRMSSMKPSLTPIISGAAAAIVIIGALGSWLATRDNLPPEIDETFHEEGILAQDQDRPEDRNTVVVQFTEEIDPASFITDQGESAIVLRHDKTDIPWPLSKMPQVTGETGNQLLLSLGKPLDEGDDYRIEFGKIADMAGNAAEPFDVEFEFEDIKPPEFSKDVKPTSVGNGYNLLRLFFSDELDKRTAEELRNFRIEPIAAPGSGITAQALDIQQVTMTEDKRAVTVRVEALDNPFIEGQEYRAYAAGIEDTSGNEVDDDEPLELNFVYRDSMPPSAIRARADTNQFNITVEFDERVVLDLDNLDQYLLLSTSSGEKPKLRKARLDASQQLLIIDTESGMRNGIDYTIQVTGVYDQAKPPNMMPDPASLEFKYEGKSDVTGPRIERISAQYSRLIITFDENVSPKISNPTVYSNFSLIDEFGSDSYTIKSAKYRPDRPNMLLLVTEEQLAEDVYFTLKTPGVEDMARNVTSEVDSEFTFATKSTHGEISIQQAVHESENSLVRVKFNRRPNPEILKNLDWITLPNEVSIEDVSISTNNPSELLIKVSGVRKGIKYTLSISEKITDLNGNNPAGALQTTFDGPSHHPVN